MNFASDVRAATFVSAIRIRGQHARRYNRSPGGAPRF
jgi:hypothetical protein